jgi:hypothetical protein
MKHRDIDLDALSIGDLIRYAESIGVNTARRFSSRSAIIERIWKQLNQPKGNR